MSDLQERQGPEEREGERKLGEIPGGEEAIERVREIGGNANHAALCFKILIGLYIGLPFSFIEGQLALVVAFGVLGVALATLVLGILALIKIKKSKGALRSNHFIAPAMVMPVLIFVVLFFSLGMRRPFGDYEKRRLIELYSAFTEYAGKNNGQWPEADKWCEVIKEDKNHEWLFIGELTFSMNIEAAPLGDAMPDNMVLLFQSKEGWNQAGGQDLIPEKSYGERIFVLFGDGRVKLVKRKDVPYLQWRLEDEGVLPVRDNRMLFATVIIILALAAIGFLVSQRRYLVKHWIFAVGLGIFAAGAGALLGLMAESWLYIREKAGGMGGLAGIIAGFAVGVCFVTWLSRIRNRTERQSSIVGSGTLAGAVAGIICSSIVHLFLMMHHEESNPANLLAGMSFGVWAGLVLSWVSCGLLDSWYKPQKEKMEEIQAGESL